MNNIKIRPYIETAFAWAKSSNCQKRKVGAVILSEQTKQILSTGYNGTVSGFKVNCNDLFAVDKFDTYYVHANIKEYVSDAEEIAKAPLTYGWTKVSDQSFKILHKFFAEAFEVHAEQNAVLNLLKSNVTIVDFQSLSIMVTCMPCVQCAKMIIGLGIKKVYYVEKHNLAEDFSVKSIFEHSGVELECVSSK